MLKFIFLPKDIAQLSEKGADDNLNNSEIYPKDARNPVVLLNFETSTASLEERKKFTLKLMKGDVQNLFENLENIQDQLDQLI